MISSRASSVVSVRIVVGVLLVWLAALALPIVAHGCHAGDHDDDDEPLLFPRQERTAD